MNNISITGNLTSDPALRTTQSGVSVCSFTVAVKRPHTSDTTDFLNCVAWRQSAEFLGHYARKGNKVGVSGALTTRSYEDSNGQRRTVYEIVADSVELCESRSSAQGNLAPAPAKPQEKGVQAATDDFEEFPGLLMEDDDDLPF